MIIRRFLLPSIRVATSLFGVQPRCSASVELSNTSALRYMTLSPSIFNPMLFRPVYFTATTAGQSTMRFRIRKAIDFYELRSNSELHYIDKSLIIKMVEEKMMRLGCFWPRRWGKSVALSTLYYFYNPPIDRNGNLIEEYSARPP